MIQWTQLKQKQRELYKAERQVENEINKYLNNNFSLEEDTDYCIWFDEDRVDLEFKNKLDSKKLVKIFTDLKFDSDMDSYLSENSLSRSIVFTKYLHPEEAKQEKEIDPIEQLNNLLITCYNNLEESEEIVMGIFETIYDDLKYAGCEKQDNNTLRIIVGAGDAGEETINYDMLSKMGFKFESGYINDQDWFIYKIND